MAAPDEPRGPRTKGSSDRPGKSAVPGAPGPQAPKVVQDPDRIGGAWQSDPPWPSRHSSSSPSFEAGRSPGPEAGGAPPAPSPSPPDVADPLEAGNGQSLAFDSLLSFRWPSGKPYLSDALTYLLREVTGRYGLEASPYEMTAEHLVNTLLAPDAPVEEVFIGQLRRTAQQLDITPRTSAPPHSLLKPIAERVILRWDVVELLLEASRLRRRTNRDDESVGTRHLAIALLRTRSGQAALYAAGLLVRDLPPLAKAFQHQLRLQKFASLGDDEAEWLRIAFELDDQKLLVSTEIETRVSYAADRAQRVTIDSLGVQEDAAALSDLILLDAAQPPLAIGLFGRWGSGKSTLIKELQHRIHEDLKAENALAAAGLQDTDPDTRRIRSAVQIEFNAWAFADSANLWASLTAEIFDQLAAGGIRPEGEPSRSDRNFAALVSEVKLRNSLAASALRGAESEIAGLEQRIGIAQAQLRSTQRQRKTAMIDAVRDTARELLKPEPEKPESAKKEAPQKVWETLSGEGDLGARIEAYATAANSLVRGVLLVWDFARGRARKWPILSLGLGVAAAVLAAIALLRPEWLGTLSDRGLALARAGAAATSVAAFWAFVVGVLPAIRVAGLLGEQVAKHRSAIRQQEAAVRSEVADLESKLAAARIARKDDQAWAEKFGGVGEEPTAASPSLMLAYLMSDSADVGALRQQQGVIAKVRRCFEQLDSVIARMRADPEAGSPVDRIILYIDDLDRCDAQQVSNVLQAVHLLLAFECFVVVVAVDARWLKQSLEAQHSQLKPSDAESDPGEAPATAADYLEKIFQIPLWVRPLVDEDAPGDRYSGYRKFVDSIARPVRPSAPPEPPSPPDPPRAGEVAGGAGGALVWSGPARPELTDQPRREGLQLSEDELQLMRDLGPLAAKSPRAVKRMINLYRLLRVRYRGERLQALLGSGSADVPSYRELLFVLACDTGLSRQSRIDLRASLARAGAAAAGPWQSNDWTAKLDAREAALVKEVLPLAAPLTGPGMFSATEEVRRYSFLP